ncbi:hypothetical protein JF50_03080 [Pseudoalteromonas luteoviolacea]|uniref:Uncharacterized protein n=1 Tax=Pseudoalteromonas luteoviolacea TaxID=43657 RepID=A0A0C1QHJ8_9GAMM|nr:hypothetical protein JF50_03080 [Pseudoalteromonas luteoviolacea]
MRRGQRLVLNQNCVNCIVKCDGSLLLFFSSTAQQLNSSTAQQLNSSTAQQLNSSTAQQLNSSTAQD